jgi:hypothetical protein
VDAIGEVMKAKDLLAVLGRTVTVRLVNVSGSGCLLESDSHVADGTTASLTVVFDGRKYIEDIRITRCSSRAGSFGYELGAEFLWTTKPGPDSLRRLVASLQSAPTKDARMVVTKT